MCVTLRVNCLIMILSTPMINVHNIFINESAMRSSVYTIQQQVARRNVTRTIVSRQMARHQTDWCGAGDAPSDGRQCTRTTNL